jgi:hypothetical protein
MGETTSVDLGQVSEELFHLLLYGTSGDYYSHTICDDKRTSLLATHSSSDPS